MISFFSILVDYNIVKLRLFENLLKIFFLIIIIIIIDEMNVYVPRSF